MRLSNEDIIELFTKIATTHPLVAHNASNPKQLRFFGFNPQEFIDRTRSDINAGTLVMGLSLPNRTPVTWNFADTGTMIRKSKFFDVAVLGKFKGADDEETVCHNAEQVLEDVVTWIYEKQATQDECDFPVLEFIDMTNVSVQRVMNVGVNKWSGAVMRLPLHDWVQYISGTNPLNSIES